MVDLFSKSRRSENMRLIRSKHTKPELGVRRMVHAMGYRFRLHISELPGKPDLVFASRKKIIDVRGCFWHCHTDCIDSHIPKSRMDYWRPKLRKNVRRDKNNLKSLRKLGWQVLIIWECEVTPSNAIRLRDKIRHFLK